MKHNKAAGIDGIHNEMLRLEPELTARVALEMWKLVGISSTYPTDWKRRLLAPVYKSGDRCAPKNYIPLCMLSCLRKAIKAAIATIFSKDVRIHAR